MELMVFQCDWRQCKSSRTLALPSEWSLAELHEALQCAFGWEFDHLYMFQSGNGRRWSRGPFYADLDEEEADEDPRKTTLAEAFPRLKGRLEYEYDFGDSNVVRLTFMKRIEGEGPACLKATGLMAEEDSAGFGYADGIARILEEGPKNEEYDDLADWLGIESEEEAKEWIAEHQANAEAITKGLQGIRPPRRKRGKK